MPNSLVRRAYGWACERLYHEFAPLYDPISRVVSLGRWDAWRKTCLAYVHGARVLELGCGTGHLLGPLAAQATWVVGLDRSARMLQQAQARAEDGVDLLQATLPPVSSHCTLVRGDAMALPFADQIFDTIVSTFPAPYILESATLRECNRTLNQSAAAAGQLVVAGLWVRPTGVGFWSRAMARAPLFYGAVDESIRTRIAARFTDAGFEVRLIEQYCAGAYVGMALATPRR